MFLKHAGIKGRLYMRFGYFDDKNREYVIDKIGRASCRERV